MLPISEMIMKRTDLWLRVSLLKKLLKDSKDLMNSMKSENSNTKSTRKVKNCLVYNARNIQLLRRQKLS